MKFRNKQNEISCFKCKNGEWKYRADCPFPIIDAEYFRCKKGHEKITYNTAFDELENFTCKDYQHSYFTKEYYGMWFYIILFSAMGLIFYLWLLK